MGRFSKAARQGDSCRGKCDIKLHTKHHHCYHRNESSCAGMSNVYVNGKAAQKVGDRVNHNSCQHGGYSVIVEGSGSVYINGKAAARVKDSARCQNGMCMQEQVIIEGSANVFFGD